MRPAAEIGRARSFAPSAQDPGLCRSDAFGRRFARHHEFALTSHAGEMACCPPDRMLASANCAALQTHQWPHNRPTTGWVAGVAVHSRGDEISAKTARTWRRFSASFQWLDQAKLPAAAAPESGECRRWRPVERASLLARQQRGKLTHNVRSYFQSDEYPRRAGFRVVVHYGLRDSQRQTRDRPQL